MRKYIQIAIAATLFGTIGIFINLIGDTVHPMVTNFYRVFFGFLTLLIICPILDKNTFKQTKNDIKQYALIGFIIAIGVSLANYAFQYAPVQNVLLILAMFPIFVFIFASIILKEKVTKEKVISLLIAFVGLIIINPLRPEGFYGNMFALLATIMFGLLMTLMRKEEKSHTIGDVVWFLFFASLFLLPFPFIFSLGEISVHVLGLGVFGTGIAYLFNNLALEKLEAETTSIISTIIQTLVGIVLAIIILSEPLNPQILLGGTFLVAAGVYLETHHKKLKEEKEEVKIKAQSID